MEDLHFAFFEYAGSNIRHYLFSEDTGSTEEDIEKIKAHFLANRIFLLADEDESSSKQEIHRELKAIQGENFVYRTTGSIEIENLLSPEIIKMILREVLNIDNEILERIFFDEDDYKNKRLGSYIYDRLKDEVKDVPKIRAKNSENSTLSTPYKNKFSLFVLEEVSKGNITWEMIAGSKHAKDLTENIYEFIKVNNDGF